MESDEKAYQLVLSVFRGLNFVVKKPGVKCKLISKVHESILESKVYNLSTSSSDPDFNHQVAWKLTKKQFQDLRLHRGVVKIECHQLSKDSKIERLIGYCTISVKDAIEIKSYEEIDAKNAITIPLKGTRSPWLQYRPKLQILLHFEAPDKPVAPPSNRKMVLSRNPSKKESRKAPLPPPPSVNGPSKFQWTVNSEMGYFQLGQPGPTDDLYIMNITLICVRYLDQLLTRKYLNEDVDWVIKFEAFGMTILSDTFTLQGNDEIKQTYLGDKSTARIRANGEVFTRYLKETALEMQIQTVLGSKETQGTGWVELAPLADKDAFEIRSVVQILPQHGKFIPANTTPQLAYVVDIQRSPEFFTKNFIQIEDINCQEHSFKSSRDDLLSLEKELASCGISDRMEVNGELIEKEKKEEKSEIPAETGDGDKKEVDRKTSELTKANEVKRQVECTALTEDTFETCVNSTTQSIGVPPAEESTRRRARQHARIASRKPNGSNPMDRLTNVCMPGNYSLTLKFTGFDVRSHSEITGNWVISFCHPPLGVSEQDSCTLVAKPRGSWSGKMCKFYFDEDEDERWEFLIPKISTEILESPLRVYFHKGDRIASPEEAIAVAHIPLGDIFIAEPGPLGRKLEGSVGMYTYRPRPNSDRAVKIGYVGYDFTLQEADENSANIVLASPSVTLATPGAFQTSRRIEPESPFVSKSRDRDVESWKAEEEQIFRAKLQEKERAYFQMLSMEHKKQKKESEKAVRSRIKELDTMKKEMADKLKEVAEKEEMLKIRESQLSEANRTNEYELTKERDDLKLMIRRLEADKKLEVESLRKRLDDALSDLEIANSKIRTLEKKLEAKELQISDLVAQKNKWPEQEAVRKIDLLEQKIEQLHRDLDKALREKEQYRAQSQQIAKALQHKSEESRELLREENENLKLQMLAARQQELLNQELKHVANVSNEIRAAREILGREGQLKSTGQANNRQSNGSQGTRSSLQERNSLLEAEIERLTKSREGLLKTQAYTVYDPLIREIEDEILKNLQLRADLLAESAG